MKLADSGESRQKELSSLGQLDAGSPPRPTMAFQVGVTGHRDLPEADIAALAAAASQFRALRAEMLRLHAADQASAAHLYAPDQPLLRCICGIAEGADSILAGAALAEGWTLVATLPFPRAEFERDFAGPALDRFRSLLGQAAAVSELDGSRVRGGEPYAQVGQQIVEQSDLMLAVWNGLPPRGPGGTGDVVQRALDRGLPVAVLPPSGPMIVEWLGAGADDVAALLHSALLPTPDAAGFPQAYYAEAPRGAGWAGAAVRWFERAALAGVRLPTQPAPPPPPITAGWVLAVGARLLPYANLADRLATEYAARYRAAGLMRYALVLPATLGAALEFLDQRWLQAAGFLLQFVSLVAVVAFASRGGWGRAHARFVAYRALAEHLRNARLLAPLGAVAMAPEAAVHHAKTADWTAWYGRAVIRQAGLGGCRYDAAAVAAAATFVRSEVAGQIAYLRGRAARFTAMASRLQRIGVILFMGGIGFELACAVLLWGNAGARPVLWTNELSLVLPALAPVFLGLLSFGEYSRLASATAPWRPRWSRNSRRWTRRSTAAPRCCASRAGSPK
jgi:hypothetical protein